MGDQPNHDELKRKMNENLGEAVAAWAKKHNLTEPEVLDIVRGLLLPPGPPP